MSAEILTITVTVTVPDADRLRQIRPNPPHLYPDDVSRSLRRSVELAVANWEIDHTDVIACPVDVS